MNDDGIVNKYVDHLKLRNLRPVTIRSRRYALERLGRWAGGPVLYLTEAQLKDWQQARSNDIDPESLRNDTSHLRQFYQWAQREGFRVDDPTARLIMPRVRRRLPRPIADGALAGAIANATTHMHVVLALAAFAGLRACEIAGLHWSDITGDLELPGAILTVLGKGARERKVPVSTVLASALRSLPERRGPLIPRLDGKPGPNAAAVVSKRANHYLHEQGIPETLHQLRHRFATVTLENCHDIRVVQELLGHLSPNTTAIYTLPSGVLTLAAVEAAGVLAPRVA